jgi:hypothetical protein
MRQADRRLGVFRYPNKPRVAYTSDNPFVGPFMKPEVQVKGISVALSKTR